jgi:hypothetical protein
MQVNVTTHRGEDYLLSARRARVPGSDPRTLSSAEDAGRALRGAREPSCRIVAVTTNQDFDAVDGNTSHLGLSGDHV